MLKIRNKDEIFMEYCNILEQNHLDDLECKKIIQKIIDKNNCNYSRIIQTEKYKNLKEWILKKTINITDSFINFNTRIYMALHEMTEIPTCKYCKRRLTSNISNIYDGFNNYCGPKCANLDPDTQNKRKEIYMQKYGVSNPLKSQKIKDKIKFIFFQKYGVDNPAKCKEIIKKQKKTKLERYGNENYVNQDKIKKTCLERYGVEYSTQSEQMKQNSKKTCLQRYGVENAGGTEVVLEKIKKTNLQKYGVEYPQQNKKISDKRQKTCIEKYGVQTPFKLDRVKKINSDRNKRISYENFLMNNPYDIPYFSIDEYINNVNSIKELQFICRKCGNIFSSIHNNGYHLRCPKCYPELHGTSNEEQNLIKFIKGIIKEDVIQNTRDIIKPYELDIYIPSKKIAFEFDGLYWHSVKAFKEKNYHKIKTDMCQKFGIQLIHIFENEWLYKPEIVKSRIKNLLGINDQCFYARNCYIQEIDPQQAFDFQEKNHLQGGVYSSINLGIFRNECLLGVMAFSKPRFSTEYDYELTRFCMKIGVSIIGGASKLLSFFENTYFPKSIISYADRRWSTGKLYERIGFSLLRQTKPSIFYFKNNSYILYNRLNFQKHKLKHIFENFDNQKTELENMLNNDYNAIYDSGNNVYVKNLRLEK